MEGKQQPTTPAINKTQDHLITTNIDKDTNKCKISIT